jgi:hypothetical protein
MTIGRGSNLIGADFSSATLVVAAGFTGTTFGVTLLATGTLMAVGFSECLADAFAGAGAGALADTLADALITGFVDFTLALGVELGVGRAAFLGADALGVEAFFAGGRIGFFTTLLGFFEGI